MIEHREPGPVDVEILDTVTGKRVRTKRFFIAYWWAEGNGSCDCNRAQEHGVDNAQEGRCDGEQRFLITDVQGDLDGYTLTDFNSGYPKELRAQFGVP